MRIFIGLTVALFLLALYAFAATSDRLDELTLDQQREVVSRWNK